MRNLYAGVSALALGVGLAGVAIADITQTTTNTGTVSSTGAEVMTGAITATGDAASVRVGATGAGSSVSAVAIDGAFDGSPLLGNVTQTSLNTPPAHTVPGIGVTTTGGIAHVAGAVEAAGASVSVSAVGAVASVAESVIGQTDAVFGEQNVIDTLSSSARNGVDLATGNVDLWNGWQADVQVANSFAAVDGDITGNGAGASVSVVAAAVDATSSVVGASTGISGPLNGFEAVSVGTIVQSAYNGTGNTVVLLGDSGVTVGGALDGLGSTAGASATGASTAVRSSVVDSNGAIGASFGVDGGINQSGTQNWAPVSVVNSAVATGDVSGHGAAASLSATGISASVGMSSVNSTITNTRQAGDITQTGLMSRANILVDGGSVSVGEVSGNAASASAGVTGVAASVFERDIGSNSIAGAQFGAITTVLSNEGSVVIDGTVITTVDGTDPANVSGHAASVSMSATGAVSSVNSSAVNSTTFTGGTFDGVIGQTVTNTAGVTVLPGGDGLTIGDLAGISSNASIGATGASASIGVSSVQVGEFNGADFQQAITQTVTNAGLGVVSVGAADSEATISAGDLSGTAASASIGATAASGNVSISSVNSGSFTAPSMGDITQTVTSSASSQARVFEGTIAAGDLSGIGSRVGIGAVAASANVSASAVATASVDPLVAGNIVQNVVQNGGIYGGAGIADASITSGALGGTAASASISAAGASASVSGTAIQVANVITPMGFHNVTQNAANNSAISVANSTITTGALGGAGASAGISATGASSSVGVTSIATTIN